MKTITVRLAKDYDIHVGTNLLETAAKYIMKVKSPCTVVIISNETIWPLYGHKITTSLVSGGFQVIHYLLPDGECNKNAENYLKILNFLAENRITRSDLIIAMGGGVVGDITGFAAATYLRGVAYIQIPTTLLAMVDSSVGGKTAIDLQQGKNLVGAFNQPCMVLCDLNALDTLTEDIFIDGCAEVIKYGILFDPDLFAHLSANGIFFDREYVISRCVELKRDVVSKDEFDTSERQLLNLGHTIGHAIEKNSCYTISHGRAVASGMAMITKAAMKAGICSSNVYKEICGILMRFGLPAGVPSNTLNRKYDAPSLYAAALSDKKRNGTAVNLIFPQKIGQCIIQNTPISQLESVIESGL